MRHLIAPLFVIPLAGQAAAHPGHLAGLAGHDHWVAGAAFGVAVAVGIWAAIKGRRQEDRVDAEDEGVTDGEEQTA
jgi:hydrogenase/urease accessory protein HupE